MKKLVLVCLLLTSCAEKEPEDSTFRIHATCRTQAAAFILECTSRAPSGPNRECDDTAALVDACTDAAKDLFWEACTSALKKGDDGV